ncbi:chromobox protein homolog 1-like [Eurosta solidaginis]|uniref:chromobox protein homolog 1-like n=1 Tax=Eurosta solidaginis TaxID=178769 RepID=UPI0035307BEA
MKRSRELKIIGMANLSNMSETDEYSVRRIVARRVANGRTEYYIGWENSWEPAENLNCPAMLAAFEEAAKMEQGKGKCGATGFDRGLEPSTILGATMTATEEILFLIQWKGEETELVPADRANVECPQLVIKFYQERLQWE